MENSELKQKLKKVGRFIFIFFLVYLIIGFFLNSNYPIMQFPFDFSKAYEVLRDGLTLSAYFLAPAAAVVLFNDWRAEHRIKSTIQLLDELERLSFGIKNGLGFYNAKIINEKGLPVKEFRNREDRQTLLWELKALNRTKRKLLIKNKELDNLKILLMSFYELANKGLNDLHHIELISFNSLCDENLGCNKDNHKEYLRYRELFDEKFNEVEELSDKIDLQVIKAQDSILQS